MTPVAVAAVLGVAYAYFYQGGGWNQNTRFALTRAVVERGQLSIDGFHLATGDKALRDGHYYSDKAPGAAWLAVPAYALARAAMKDPTPERASGPGPKGWEEPWKSEVGSGWRAIFCWV